jgi:hypothetical protein
MTDRPDLPAIKARLDAGLGVPFVALDITRDDADFIAHAPDDIAALLAEVEQLRAVVEAAKEIAANSVIDSDARLRYVIVQPDRTEWGALLQAIEALEGLDPTSPTWATEP